MEIKTCTQQRFAASGVLGKTPTSFCIFGLVINQTKGTKSPPAASRRDVSCNFMKNRTLLKINAKSELVALKDLIFVTVLWLILCLIFPFFEVFIALVISYLILFFIPTVYLHSNYEKYNKGIDVIINHSEIIFNGDYVKKDSITKINAIGCPSPLGIANYSRLAHMTGYYYLEVITNDDRRIILTSLLDKNILKIIKENFPDITINLSSKFYPLI